MQNIRILAQGVLKLSCCQGFSIALMVESRRLNIDPNPYVKYQNPSLSGSQDIVLTRFSHCYNGKVEKGA